MRTDTTETEQRIEQDQGRSCCSACGGTFAGAVRANRTAQEAAAPKAQAAPRRPQLSWADFLKLSKVLRGNKRAWLWFATLTGGDYGELLFLRRDDIDLERGTLHIRGNKSRTRDRFVPLHPRLAAHVRTLKLAPDAHILKPWRNRVRNLRKACIEAGLPYAMTLKDLRRVYLSGATSGWGEEAAAPKAQAATLPPTVEYRGIRVDGTIQRDFDEEIWKSAVDGVLEAYPYVDASSRRFGPTGPVRSLDLLIYQFSRSREARRLEARAGLKPSADQAEAQRS